MESAWAQHGWFHADSVPELKNQNCDHVFFGNGNAAPVIFLILTQLRQAITPFKKVLHPKSTTFPKCSGRQLSLGTPLDGVL